MAQPNSEPKLVIMQAANLGFFYHEAQQRDLKQGWRRRHRYKRNSWHNLRLKAEGIGFPRRMPTVVSTYDMHHVGIINKQFS